MANTSYKNAAGAVEYAKSDGAGTNDDPKVMHRSIDSIAAGASADIGAVGDAAVTTNTTGSLSGKLRGLVALIAALARGSGNVDANTLRVITAADGPLNTATGAISDAAVTTNTTGSISGKLRGMVAILADVWDSTNHWLKAQMQAGEAHIGEVSSSSVLLTVTLSTDTNIYADGDVLADTQEVANALRVAGAPVGIYSITVLDKDDQGFAFDLYFLRSNVSMGTENSVPNISDANAEEILGRIQVDAGDYYDVGGAKLAHVPLADQSLPLLVATSGTSLWVAAIARGAGTYSASGLVLKLGLVRN